MCGKLASLLLVFLLLFTLTVASEEDDKANIFESNIDSWTFAGDGVFGPKTDYYGQNGLFMSDRTVQYVYAMSEMQASGEKSFTFEVEFDVPSYDTTGAEHGWCWQNIFLGVKDPEEPGSDERMSIRFQHYPEGKENITMVATYSGFNESIPLPEEKVGDMSHKVLFYYSVVDESLTVTVDGEELFRLEDIREEIEGHLGFGATWCAMRVLKAVYTELDETPVPKTPTPEPKNTPTPAPTDARPTPTPTKKNNGNVDMAKILTFILGAVVIVLLVAVVVIVVMRRKR